MLSCNLHIIGRVQGVGFRPYAFRLAKKYKLKGWVRNDLSGLHVKFEGPGDQINNAIDEIRTNPPYAARIYQIHSEASPHEGLESFTILESMEKGRPDLTITPDLALCPTCKAELATIGGRRSKYAFTNCVDCGPRYSIITGLPYDRERTTMSDIHMCTSCNKEYSSPGDRRFHAQTNTCCHCAIGIHLTSPEGKNVLHDTLAVERAIMHLQNGKIIAVKGIGGYLLICDASNRASIINLRRRKNRPSKPFALLYPSIDRIDQDVVLSKSAVELLQSAESPIVLLKRRDQSLNLVLEAIAPGLDSLGVMLPCAPILWLLQHYFDGPLIATSANLSGAPIEYEDESALERLSGIADYFLQHDRSIVTPQDDSVVRLTLNDKPILLRRSRGLAPTFIPGQEMQSTLNSTGINILAMGADLKAAFTMTIGKQVYVSQYLGNLSTYESELAYRHTIEHLNTLLKHQPDVILTDLHPGYISAEIGREFGTNQGVPVYNIQHHKAHFASVLGEHNLISTAFPVLGFVFDGMGWGDDEQVWGGECFIYSNHEISRIAHLPYFTNLSGDKMAQQPRLSALSILRHANIKHPPLKDLFSQREWNYYRKELEKPRLVSSSMGRLFDAVGCLLDLGAFNEYEGQTAMKLEALARSAPNTGQNTEGYSFNVSSFIKDLLHHIMADLDRGLPKAQIAFLFHLTLVDYMRNVAENQSVRHLAFSGGVFQNTLLVDLLTDRLGGSYHLYFNEQLSPNDEGVSFGQLSAFLIDQHSNKIYASINKNNDYVSGYSG